VRAAAVAILALGLVLAGCGVDEESAGTAALPDVVVVGGSPQRDAAKRGQSEPETVAPSHCPSGHPACRTTEGRIVYVERVDPDGDGDAHFVIADSQGITLPGLTAIDVRKGLRPRPLPGPGDLVSAAGPVQSGSYGQSQIHALELHVGK
jgi:hypothetical protein